MDSRPSCWGARWLFGYPPALAPRPPSALREAGAVLVRWGLARRFSIVIWSVSSLPVIDHRYPVKSILHCRALNYSCCGVCGCLRPRAWAGLLYRPATARARLEGSLPTVVSIPRVLRAALPPRAYRRSRAAPCRVRPSGQRLSLRSPFLSAGASFLPVHQKILKKCDFTP